MIYIDTRVGSKELLQHASLKDVSEGCILRSGDVYFRGKGEHGDLTIGIELKSIGDLLSSMDSGRLQATQIPRMFESYDVLWLLYYGIMREDSETGMLQVMRRGKQRKSTWVNARLGGKRKIPATYLERFLLDLSAMGVGVRHVLSKEAASKWIRVCYDWWSKEWADHKAFRVFDKSASLSLMPGVDKDVMQRAKMVDTLPTMGFERAMTVAHRFQSMPEMLAFFLTADKSDWAEIEGIGPLIGDSLRNLLHER